MSVRVVRTVAVTSLAVAMGLGLSACGDNPVSFSPASGTAGPSVGASSTDGSVDASGRDGGVQVSAPGVKISGGDGGVKVEAPGVSISGGDDGVRVSSADGAAAAPALGGTVAPGSTEDRLVFTVDSSVAGSADERAVAEVFRRYMTLRMRASHHDTVTVKEVGAVASGEAATEVLDLLDYPTKSVGSIDAQVAKVSVDGSSAKVVSCFSGRGREVDDSGKVVEEINQSLQLDVDIERVGRTWKVVETKQNAQSPSCG